MPPNLKEAHNFREMMEAIPFDENQPKKFIPVYNTLVLFLSDYNALQERKEDDFRVEKSLDELSQEAEENLKWMLKQYRHTFESEMIVVIVRLKEKRWRPVNSEFKKNGIVKINTVPTLIWFDEPYALEGPLATDFMLIKEFFDFKLHEIELNDNFLPEVEEEIDEKVIVDFKSTPKFSLKFWNLRVAKKAAEEADKRVRQVEEGKCQYEVMMDAFLKMGPKKRKKFLKELDEAGPEMLPFGGTDEREDSGEEEQFEKLDIELTLDKPNIKTEIIEVERYPTPEQRKEAEQPPPKKAAKKPKKKKKGKGKKGKGKGKKGAAKGKKGAAKGKKGGKKKK